MAAAVEFTAWAFLTTPLPDLLELFDAHLHTVENFGADFMGAVVRTEDDLVVMVRAEAPELEQEMTARSGLARWYDVDLSDWPVEMRFYEGGVLSPVCGRGEAA